MRRALYVAVAVAALAVFAVVLHSSRELQTVTTEPVNAPTARPVPPSAATEIPSAPIAQAKAAPTAATLTVDDVMAAQQSSEPGAVETMIDGLSSTDAVVVAESANGLVGRGALAALPVLEEIDVAARPWAAPSAIYAMGALAAKASPDQREETVDRLLALLASEKQRPATDALANLLQIYQALGQSGDPRAIGPLEAELADASVATAPKVVVVQALVALGARDSKPALVKLRDQLAPQAVGPDFEAELRRDLIAAISDALERLA
ncbi:MAG TPA: hypothetical protein VGM90_13515 [Kofleriaceae bacterium]|jgi:hypothetical protein